MAEDRILSVVRIRPLSIKELADGCRPVAQCPLSGDTVTMTDPSYFYSNGMNKNNYERNFRYDHCIQETQTQSDVFRITGKQQLINCFEGLNCSILAFGQTGSGKTYSMFGEANTDEIDEEKFGIIPMLCKQMLARMRELLLMASSMGTSNIDEDEGEIIKNKQTLTGATLSVSFYEIYNEKVHDLLSASYDAIYCKVREHPVDGAYVDGLNIYTIESYEEALYILAEGQKKRSVAATLMNSSSSRSHAIFTVYLEQQFQHATGNSRTLRRSKVCLVDLAGSEKVNMTGVTGDRLVEANNINKSLSTLGEVIKALSEAKKESSFVPYRNSVLTWLLKDSLGGNSRTIMLATINPADYSYSESISTLKYIERAKLIVTKAVVNETSDSSATILKLQTNLTKLQSRLEDATDIIKSQQVQLEHMQCSSTGVEEVEAREARIAELSGDLEALQGAMYLKIEENEMLRGEMERMLVAGAELQHECRVRDGKIVELSAQVDQLSRTNQEVVSSSEQLLQEHREGWSKSREQQATLEILRRELLEYQSKEGAEVSGAEELTALRCDLVYANNQIGLMQSELGRLRLVMEERDASATVQTSREASLEEKTESMARIIAERDSALTVSYGENSELQRRLVGREAEVSSLSDAVEALRETVMMKDSLMEELRLQLGATVTSADVEETSSQFQLIESLRDNLVQAQADLSTAQSEANKNFASRVLQFDSDMSSLMNANEDLAAQLLKSDNELLHSRKQFIEAQAELTGERSRAKALATEVELVKKELASKSESLSLVATDKMSMKALLDASQAQLKDCQQERDKLKAECSDLQQSLAQFQASKASVHQELRAMTDNYEQSVQAMSAMHRQLTDLALEKKALQASQKEIENLQSVLAMLREVNSQIDAELVQKNKTIVASTLFVSELKGEIATLTSINDAQYREINMLRADLADARASIDKYCEINSYIEREMCTSEEKPLSVAVNDAMDELLDRKRLLEELRFENGQLKATLQGTQEIDIAALMEADSESAPDPSREAGEQEQSEYLSQELIQSKLLAAELDYQNEELQLAYRAVEKRNIELKLKLAHVLSGLEEDLRDEGAIGNEEGAGDV